MVSSKFLITVLLVAINVIPCLSISSMQRRRQRVPMNKKEKIGGGDEFELEQRDYVAATVGKSVQLDCKMREEDSNNYLESEKHQEHFSSHSGSGNDGKIVWLKMPRGEVLSLNGNRVSGDSRITTKCVTGGSAGSPCWSLMIERTRESDSGFYVCQTNSMKTKYVYLDIMVPPKLLTQYPVDRIDVNQTMNATITCEFYGKPEPLIKWYKYQAGRVKELAKLRGLQTINLYIHKDSPSEFECVADNSIPPTVSKKIYLNIQRPPKIKFQNSRVFQKKGEQVIFDCKVSANPHAKVSWYKNHVPLYDGPTRKTTNGDESRYLFENLDNSFHRLYIKNVTDEDFTYYHCRAVNMLGKAISRIELIEIPSELKSTTPVIVATATTTTIATTVITKTQSNSIKNWSDLFSSKKTVNYYNSYGQESSKNLKNSNNWSYYNNKKEQQLEEKDLKNQLLTSHYYKNAKSDHNNNEKNDNDDKTSAYRISRPYLRFQNQFDGNHTSKFRKKQRNHQYNQKQRHFLHRQRQQQQESRETAPRDSTLVPLASIGSSSPPPKSSINYGLHQDSLDQNRALNLSSTPSCIISVFLMLLLVNSLFALF